MELSGPIEPYDSELQTKVYLGKHYEHQAIPKTFHRNCLWKPSEK